MSEGRGILVVFDGIDGGGKTTQVRLLRAALEKANIEVVTSKEPTDGPWGKLIRRSTTEGRMPLDEELNAFIADRKEHLEYLVRPALAEGKVVILDRYYFSTISYQGASGKDKELLKTLMEEIALTPDITFIVDVPLEVSKDRILVRDGCVNHFENIDYLTEVRKAYKWLCSVDKSLLEIDGSLPIDVVHSSIVKLLVDEPLKKKRCFKEYGCDSYPECGYAMTGACEWWDSRQKLLASLPVPSPYLALNTRTNSGAL